MNRNTVAVLVNNHFGVLNRVTSMFRRRQFNISALTVSETETNKLSRITVVFDGEDNAKQQLINQLYKLPDVCSIKEFSSDNSISSELLLIKIKNSSERHQEIMDTVNIFKGNIIDYAPESFCIEVTGESSKLDTFISVVSSYGIIEMCRTGAVALSRGSTALREMDMGYLNVYKKD
jgi:acetolactate synthase-1/3 small subunit